MKQIKYLAVLLLLALLNACASTSVNTEFAPNIKGDSKEPLATICAENYGYYLFGFIPICCGDPTLQNEVSMSFFEDTVTIENNYAMIAREASNLKADEISDIQHRTNWTGGFSLWIVWRQSLNSNALALKLPEVK